MREVRFHTIVAKPGISTFFSLSERNRFNDRARQEAADFVNRRIGDGALISISEEVGANFMGLIGLTITIWYRADLMLEKPEPSDVDPIHP
jgi:hypothetical protein